MRKGALCPAVETFALSLTSLARARRQPNPRARRTAAAEVLSDDPNVSLYDKYMGYDMAEDPNVLRFNHYWCERFADPLPVEDDSMIQLVAKVEKWAKERERERERTKVN